MDLAMIALQQIVDQMDQIDQMDPVDRNPLLLPETTKQ